MYCDSAFLKTKHTLPCFLRLPQCKKSFFFSIFAKVQFMLIQYLYDTYKNKCRLACPYPEIVSNTAVELCYEKYPSKNKNFIWKVSGDDIVKNIKQVNIELPYKDNDGKYSYLGRKYNFRKIDNNELEGVIY